MAAVLRALLGGGLYLLVGVRVRVWSLLQGPFCGPGTTVSSLGCENAGLASVAESVGSLPSLGSGSFQVEFSKVMTTEEGSSVPPKPGSLFVGREMG